MEINVGQVWLLLEYVMSLFHTKVEERKFSAICGAAIHQLLTIKCESTGAQAVVNFKKKSSSWKPKKLTVVQLI